MGSTDENWVQRHPATPPQFRVLHRVLIGMAIFFFFYLMIEGTILLPLMLIRYGTIS